MIRRLLTATTIGTTGLALLALGSTALADGGPGPGISLGDDGILSPSGVTRWVAISVARNTVVAAVRTDGGRVLRHRSLSGTYGVPLVAFDGTTGGLSTDGKALVLASPGWPIARFVFLDPTTLRLRKRVSLRGAFSFDALSPDARMLFLVQLVSPGRSSRYLVRAYDVERGRLLAKPVRDPHEQERTMHGYPVGRVTSPDGTWSYTLYTSDEGHVFVHALDTRHAKAHCIDLPYHGSRQASWAMRLELSADGRQLVASDHAGDPFATIDTATLGLDEPETSNPHPHRATERQAARGRAGNAATLGAALGSSALVVAGAAIAAARRARRWTRTKAE
jgi:hypothetical protein